METKDVEENGTLERRKNKRYNIPTVVNCKFFEEVANGQSSFQGFIRDISFGGVSLEISDDCLNLKEELLKYTNIEMEVELNSPEGINRVGFGGIIKWHRSVKKEELDLSRTAETEPLYFKDWQKHSFTAKVAKIIRKNVVLESTYFYPTSGGQQFDTGTLDGIKVVDITKQGPHIIHILETKNTEARTAFVTKGIREILKKKERGPDNHYVFSQESYYGGLHP